MSTRNNDVTLFSNGIGHFLRVYKIPAGKQEDISIPFKRDNIGDVAASLQVFGNVRLVTPPSFTPMNANATQLRIDQSDALKSMLRNLSGATVTIKDNNDVSTKCILLGLDSDQSTTFGSEMVVNVDYVVLSNSGTVFRRSLDSIQNIQFDDESVRTEIDKALKNNFQSIKPDSTLLELTLSATNDTEAIVQYTIPVAAWKMRYAIREVKGSFSLEGAAIIDNNTDEDWDNFRISVVTGNPISFATDIANVVVPLRKMVQLVDSEGLSNVDVEPAYAESRRNYGAKNVMALRACSTQNVPYFSGSPAGGAESLEDMVIGGAYSNSTQMIAEAPGVESREVGDFCVFTSKEPITILARKSAVVSMFTLSIKDASTILMYKENSDKRRPFRSVQFRNESEYSLGKGKVIIYNDGIFSGESVMESTKPNESRMLPHCLENGVKIYKDSSPLETKRSSLRISDGIVVVEDLHTSRTTYTVENKKDETFKLVIEHKHQLTNNVKVNFKCDAIKSTEKLASGLGHRVYLEIKPKQTLQVACNETSLNSQDVVLNGQFGWFANNIISTKNPLALDKQVLAAAKIQQQIDAAQKRLSEVKASRQELTAQSERIRSNISATKDVNNNLMIAQWIKSLDSTETEIQNIEKVKLPELAIEIRELTSKLSDEIQKLSATWNANE